MVFLLLLVAGDRTWNKPDRTPYPERIAPVSYAVLPLPSSEPGALALRGLWQVTMNDPRFGGVSALAMDEGLLIAATDSGSIFTLPQPGGGRAAVARDLPAGPGSPYWKKFRDAESLAPDPAGRGWWVGFEFQHSLYLYDRGFTKALRRIVFPEERWAPNKSFEAILPVGDDLLALPEGGDELLRVDGGKVIRRPLESGAGAPADAVRLPDGRVLVLLRTVRPWGLRNELAELRRGPAGYDLLTLGQLPLGPLDNAEAIAAEPRPGGGTRLWIMTDDDFSKRRPTLLMSLDLPASIPNRRSQAAAHGRSTQ